MPTTRLGHLKQLLFPTFCLGCSLEGEWICPQCLRGLEIADTKRCALCKKAAQNSLCTKCQAETGLDGVVALLSYKQPLVRNLIGAIKYRKQYDSLDFFTQQFRRAIDKRLPQLETVVTFVPQAPSRYHERGFNQAELLAAAISETSTLQLVDKIRETAPQAKLNKKERQNNLKRAFKARSIKSWPKQVIICDDVITTGTTLSQVAKILRRKGVEIIWAVTIAHD